MSMPSPLTCGRPSRAAAHPYYEHLRPDPTRLPAFVQGLLGTLSPSRGPQLRVLEVMVHERFQLAPLDALGEAADEEVPEPAAE